MTDLEAIRALPQRYARAVDGGDIDAVGALFDPDGEVEGMRGPAKVPQYLEGMRNAPKLFTGSMHVLGDPLISHEPGSDTAGSDCYAVVYQLRAPDDPDGDLTLGMRYVDRLRRTNDGRWLITHRKATPLWQRGKLPG